MFEIRFKEFNVITVIMYLDRFICRNLIKMKQLRVILCIIKAHFMNTKWCSLFWCALHNINVRDNRRGK